VGSGNDTIDRYPPACGKVEKILCVSEKTFKKIVKDFGAFFKGSKANQESFNPEPNKGQINKQESSVKEPKPKTKSHQQQALPYGLMTNPSHFEPSSGLYALNNSRNHRVGRVNDWNSTYGQGMYE